MKVACVQSLATDDKVQNVAALLALVDLAGSAGAKLIVTPELAEYIGSVEGHKAAAEFLDGETLPKFKAQAREYGAWILIGSMHEKVGDQARYRNTSVLISPEGEIAATYSKTHLFDVTIAGQFDYRESDMSIPGERIVTADVEGVTLGLSICYDLRFPELYRALTLAGARILCVPSAFQLYTGRDHWEVLLRARAIENGCFVIAPGTLGGTPPTAGRSMIVDPWGVVLAQAPDKACVIYADLDLEHQSSIRERLPVLSHRRSDLY